MKDPIDEHRAVPSTVSISGKDYLYGAIPNQRSRRSDLDFLLPKVIRLGRELA